MTAQSVICKFENIYHTDNPFDQLGSRINFWSDVWIGKNILNLQTDFCILQSVVISPSVHHWLVYCVYSVLTPHWQGRHSVQSLAAAHHATAPDPSPDSWAPLGPVSLASLQLPPRSPWHEAAWQENSLLPAWLGPAGRHQPRQGQLLLLLQVAEHQRGHLLLLRLLLFKTIFLFKVWWHIMPISSKTMEVIFFM